MEMDLTQVSQMLKFLDEERQRDKAIIAALQERLEIQAEQLARQEEQLAALQGTVAGVEAVLTRATEFTRTVEQFKAEIDRMLDDREEKRRKEQRDAERARQLEVGALKDEVSRLTEQWQRVRMDEFLASLQAEDRRLNEVLQRVEGTIGDLGKRSEDRVQTVTYLEEQRRADNRRIASLEADTTELRKRAEASDARLLLFEEALRKEATRIDQGLGQIKEFGKAFEEMRVADFRRAQQFKKWTDQAEELRQEIERLREERQRFLDQYQQARKALDGVEAFQARMDTRQNEVAEMQRLAEDRLKRQWEEWQAASEKEHRRRQLEFEEAGRRQQRTNKEHDERLKALEERATGQGGGVVELCETLSAQARASVEALQEQLSKLQEIARTVKES
jgi:chromosome segregation ATPase